MPIVSSAYTLGHPQADGRRYVVESHTDSAGKVHRVEYGPIADSANHQAILTARAAAMNEQLAAQEATEAFEVNAAPVLVHQTNTQLADRFRAAYRVSSDISQAKLATWILARITAGMFTDAQVRTAFGMTTTNYNLMKTRMTTLRDQWAGVQAARGE